MKAQLASRGEEVAKLQQQLVGAQEETQDLKAKYGELATEAQELAEALKDEVCCAPARAPPPLLVCLFEIMETSSGYLPPILPPAPCPQSCCLAALMQTS